MKDYIKARLPPSAAIDMVKCPLRAGACIIETKHINGGFMSNGNQELSGTPSRKQL